MPMRKLWFICVTLALVCLCAPGCGDDDDDPNSGNNITTNNGGPDIGGPDADGPDAGDVDVGVDVGGPDSDAGPSQDTDTDPPLADFCDAIEDLGSLGVGATHQATGDTAQGSHALDPSCGSDGRKEVTFQFQVDEPARVQLEVQSQTADEWTMSLFSGSCDSPEHVKCKEGTADVFVAEAGVTYFLSLEAAEDAAFGLSLKTTALGCAPVGSSTCEVDQVTHCETGHNEVTYGCAYDCEGDACGGDTCSSALVVSGSGSHSFTGSYTGYKSQFNFSNHPDCSFSGSGANTPGPDLVFSLPGLSGGDTVTIDASNDDVQQGIFVLEGCSNSQPDCVEGGLVLSEVLDWNVPDDGDYHVVVDALDQSDDDFEITITR
jgi:hypothetical protein